MLSGFVLILAFILDKVFGEARKYHPLIGFGNLANVLETNFNRRTDSNTPHSVITKAKGMLCWLMIVLPLPLFYYSIHQEHWIFYIFDVAIVYFAIGFNSLEKHANQILTPLKNNDIQTARHFCSYIVSRNTEQLNEQEIARATTESVLENGHDAVIASLFWFVIGGAPLVLAHRFANTLDAMWGYKNARFINFGWFSARIDDLFGWPSAKITCLLFALQGNPFQALKHGLIQGRKYKSLNGGWVMATGATVLNIKLGGSVIYHGKQSQSVELGCGNSVTITAISPSLRLVRRAALLFIYAAFLYDVFNYLMVNQ